MKFLAVFFLVGLGLASANPVSFDQELSLDHVEELDYLLRSLVLGEGDDDGPQTELGKMLNKHLEELLRIANEQWDRAKEIKEETLEKIKDIKDKLKDMKIEVTAVAKQLLEKFRGHVIDKLEDFKEKIRDLFRNIFGKNESKRHLANRRDLIEGIIKQLFETFKDALLKAIETGKNMNDKFLDKIKEFCEKYEVFRDRVLDLLNGMLEGATEKIKVVVEEIKDRLNLKRQHDQKRDLVNRSDYIRSYIESMFKRMLELADSSSILANLALEAIIKTFTIFCETTKGSVDIGLEIANNFLKTVDENGQKLLERLTNIMNNIKERNTGKRNLNSRNEVINRIFDPILKVIMELVEQGKVIGKGLLEKAKIMLDQYQELRVRVRQILLDHANKLSGKIRESFIELMKDLGLNKEDEEGIEKRSIKEIFEKITESLKQIGIDLKGKFVKLGEYFKDALERGFKAGNDKIENIKEIAKQVIKEAKEGITTKLKDVSEQLLEVISELKDHAGEEFSKLKEELANIVKGKN